MITQTEIIARAIMQIDNELDGWMERCGGSENRMYGIATDEIRAKREELCSLYLIQTGKKYD